METEQHIMRIWNKEDMLADIEAHVDRTSLGAVLDILAEVATLKAQHICETKDDLNLERAWKRAAAAVQCAADSDAVGQLP